MKLESEFSTDLTILFQRRGAVLGVDRTSEQVLFTSQNAGSFVAMGAVEDIWGRQARDVLGREITHALRNAESQRTIERRRLQLGQFELAGQFSDLTVFRTGDMLILETVPTRGEREPGAAEVLRDVDVLTDALLMGTRRDRVLKRLVSLFRIMSGFHCVALDRRSESSAEIVVAAGREELAGAVCEAPEQLHILKDANAEGCRLSGCSGVGLLDFHLSTLQLPSSSRLDGFRKLGVEACSAIGIRCSGQVWGSLKFLHARPRVPNKRTQFALAHVAPLIGQVLRDDL